MDKNSYVEGFGECWDKNRVYVGCGIFYPRNRVKRYTELAEEEK